MEKSGKQKGSVKEYVRHSLIAFLWDEPYSTSKWIKGILKESGISKLDLKNIFVELLRDYGSNKRYREIFKICHKANFNIRLIK
jgi:hypothetical protein